LEEKGMINCTWFELQIDLIKRDKEHLMIDLHL
jgi:hypothetical protein